MTTSTVKSRFGEKLLANGNNLLAMAMEAKRFMNKRNKICMSFQHVRNGPEIDRNRMCVVFFFGACVLFVYERRMRQRSLVQDAGKKETA